MTHSSAQIPHSSCVYRPVARSRSCKRVLKPERGTALHSAVCYISIGTLSRNSKLKCCNKVEGEQHKGATGSASFAAAIIEYSQAGGHRQAGNANVRRGSLRLDLAFDRSAAVRSSLSTCICTDAGRLCMKICNLAEHLKLTDLALLLQQIFGQPPTCSAGSGLWETY